MHSTASTREADPKLGASEKKALRMLDYDTIACADAQETLEYIHKHKSIENIAPRPREIWLWRNREWLFTPETMGDKCSAELQYEWQLQRPLRVRGELELGGVKWRNGDFALDAQQQDQKYGAFWKAPRSCKPGDDGDDALLDGIAPEQPCPKTEAEPKESEEETTTPPATEKQRKPTLRIRTTFIIRKVASKLR